jgi:glycosyltransferase involved in cell wall biosynthesis
VRRQLGIPDDACVAIHVARIDPMKDHATGVAAAARSPDVFGLFVGEGTEKLALPANARGLGRRSDVADLYAAADIVLSTSAFGEGFSNALTEGMSAGLIPIATDVGDASAIVGKTGAVLAPGDLAGFVNAINETTLMTPDARRMRGIAARDRVCELYSLDRAVDRFAKLYSP